MNFKKEHYPVWENDKAVEQMKRKTIFSLDENSTLLLI
jgi:hypothetical protein